jgi:superfamily I DNA/RNA helicase
MNRPDPTPEQQEIVSAFRDGRNLVIEAGAGTGKTSTLKMAAAATPQKRGLYVAYNKAIAMDAAASFPSSVQCSTAHSLAFGTAGRQFRHRLNGPRVPARDVARILRIDGPTRLGDINLAPVQVARLVSETVARFCRSADAEPSPWHAPRKPGLDDPATYRELGALLIPLARRAWDDITSMDGQLKFEHDHYLKIWQLSGPVLNADYLLLDEAQDANPVVLDVVTRQKHAQLVAVGDRSQAIYGWRGAVDAMDQFPADERLSLSQSFRFGPAIAREANKWLAVLDADLRLTGYDRISSMTATLATPDAVLCRTNAEAMAQAMAAMEDGHATAIVGGGREIRALAEAAVTLKAGAGTHHPELFAFRTWGEVQDYAENDPAGSDLRVLVKLIDDHGPDVIMQMVDRLTDERRAEVIVSTAHKAKGREWDSVKIAGDFREPKRDPEKPDEQPEIPAAEAMLAYVAVTRAKLTLDRTGLAWVDNYLPAASPE